MNNLILVRHGQSFWNKEKRFTGWADIDLTEHGKSEARWAGQLIKELHIEFDTYFTSVQKRAIHTIEIILDILNKKNSEIKKAWELNERHYGELTGLNKDEMMKKHGEKKVHIWRRSFDVSPPPMKKTNPNHPSKNKAYIKIPANKIPNCESLKNTFERVIPYYEKNIKPIISSNKNILITAHGNSLRALCKKLLNISDKEITNFEIPTGNPLLLVFDKNLKVIKYKYLDAKRAKKMPINL
jgi:2,3-bisphosphoglycerate-dependent phosphoglycerate mutase